MRIDDDVNTLKSMGCITIAGQYKRMAKALMKIEKYAQSRNLLLCVDHVEATAGAALKRFIGGK